MTAARAIIVKVETDGLGSWRGFMELADGSTWRGPWHERASRRGTPREKAVEDAVQAKLRVVDSQGAE